MRNICLCVCDTHTHTHTHIRQICTYVFAARIFSSCIWKRECYVEDIYVLYICMYQTVYISTYTYENAWEYKVNMDACLSSKHAFLPREFRPCNVCYVWVYKVNMCIIYLKRGYFCMFFLMRYTNRVTDRRVRLQVMCVCVCCCCNMYMYVCLQDVCL